MLGLKGSRYAPEKYNEVKTISECFYQNKLKFLEKHRKRTAKVTPKIENIYIYILNIYREYLFCLQSNASGSVLQTCIKFVKQKLKFSHIEGSMIT